MSARLLPHSHLPSESDRLNLVKQRSVHIQLDFLLASFRVRTCVQAASKVKLVHGCIGVLWSSNIPVTHGTLENWCTVGWRCLSVVRNSATWLDAQPSPEMAVTPGTASLFGTFSATHRQCLMDLLRKKHRNMSGVVLHMFSSHCYWSTRLAAHSCWPPIFCWWVCFDQN